MQGANKQLPIFANEFNLPTDQSGWHMKKIAKYLILAGLVVNPFAAKANFFENCSAEQGAEKCMEIILSTYPCYLEKLDISKTFHGDYQEMLFMGIDAALTDMGISRSYARQIATKQKTMNALASYIQRKCPGLLSKLGQIKQVYASLDGPQRGDQEMLTFEVFSNDDLYRDYFVRTQPLAVKKLGIPTNNDLNQMRLGYCERMRISDYRSTTMNFKQYCKKHISTYGN